MNDKELGALGENIAVRYLKEKGYEILGRNFTVGFSSVDKGEIDIIVRKAGVISFVEVKTSENPIDSFSPEQRAGYPKQRKLEKLGQLWLDKNKIFSDVPWQIDVIGIKINRQSGKAQVSHFENVTAI